MGLTACIPSSSRNCPSAIPTATWQLAIIFFLAALPVPLSSVMRLLTHNLLACHAKGCGSSSNNFPLELRNVQLELIEAEWNEAFLRGFLPKLDWPALVHAAQQLGQGGLPPNAPDLQASEETLRALHHILLELHIAEGEMVCPNCSHVYPIRSGIPNMVRRQQAPAEC